ncbi:right-handed parallel beta-helix repeat-containing protein [Patulibacter defluvii]|uniref:right-handed parallel beta-helix repeat-containing protein n=1 Tax=Patulibacter defluvii TaxID=3095358 RepID=UPI002A74B76C|nr:right-handed parallel beta-helix repeat-containing protein [Patulibacter sp. DM4]
MSRLRRATATAAVVIGTLGFAGTASAANTTYYVDAAGGSDANAGTSPEAAWKTLAKVNATTFSQGDKILLHSDQTWVEQLRPKGSGVAGNPITIGNYGGGAKPIVDGKNVTGGGAGGGAVYLVNQNHWTITGLEVTNDNGTANVVGSNRVGILVNNTSGTLKTGITIKDNYVRDVNGCFTCNGANAQTNGGISVVADTMNGLGNGASSYKDVQITDNVVERVGRTGINFDDYSTGFLFYFVSQDALSKNVTIARNTLKDIDSDGIILRGSKENLIERNTVDGAGSVTSSGTQPGTVGMFVAKTTNTVIQFNEVSRVQTHVVDGHAYDVDLFAYNTIVQHNYSHDNEGGLILLMGGLGSGSNATVRYNLSVNDGFAGDKGIVSLSSGLLNGSKIYNNTIYIKPGLNSPPIAQQGWSGDNNNGWWFRNNVVVNHGTGTWQLPRGTGTTISNNLIYGNHTAGEPADPQKITADPQMIDPPTEAPYGIENVGGYQLAATSPAVGSGALIPDNGGRDFFGRPVSATLAPSRGFHEAQ